MLSCVYANVIKLIANILDFRNNKVKNVQIMALLLRKSSILAINFITFA
jgi:hypothetical protein